MGIFKIFLLTLAQVLLVTVCLSQDGGFGGPSLPSGSGSIDSRSSDSSAGASSDSGVGIIVGENYVLKPSDVILVNVYKETDLNKRARIEGDGSVDLALIGKVKVAGMTLAEAQSLITDLYNRDYLVDPHVSVLVVSFSPKVIHVLGSVNGPGKVRLPPDRDLTLTEAMAGVGGVSRIGNSKKIIIKRLEPDGRSRQLEVNFDRIVTDPDAKDIILQEGDTIWVPERII